MTIIFPVNDFLFQIFPVEKNNIKELEQLIKRFYTDGPFVPKVEITEEFIKITIDTKLITEDKASYQRVLDYCEKGQFQKAKPLRLQESFF